MDVRIEARPAEKLGKNCGDLTMRLPGYALLAFGIAVPPFTYQTPAPSAAGQVVYVRCGALWDGKAEQLQRNVIISIAGARITAVGAAIPPGQNGLIDLGDQTCLPGLIDTHTHVLAISSSEVQQGAQEESPAARTIRGVALARRALEYGFTSIRDLNSMGVDAADADISRAISRGLIAGPRMQVSTAALSVSGFSTSTLRACDGADGCRRAVREAVSRGANWIKVFGDRGVRRQDNIFDDRPTFTLEELRAIVDEAHREGRRVAAHASGRSSVHLAVDAGVDSIEHGMYIAPEDMDAMAAKGIWYVPSLYLMTKAVFGSAEEAARNQAGIDVIVETFRRAERAHVKIAYGTDIGAFDWTTTPAVQLPLMVQYGFTSVQALKSATSAAAELLQTQRDVGTIETGKFADIIAVPGNPLDDVALLQKVSFVMKGGAVIRR
jgi:imidazolonepropionase-like amidohydrolase